MKKKNKLLPTFFFVCVLMPLLILSTIYKNFTLVEYSKWKFGRLVNLDEKTYLLSDDAFIRKNADSKILFLGYFLEYEDIITVSPDDENFIQFFRNQFANNSEIITVDVCDFLFIHKINNYKEIVWFNKQLKLKFQMKSKKIDQTHFSRLCNLISPSEHFD